MKTLKMHSLLVVGILIFSGCVYEKGVSKFEPGLISTSAVEYSCTFSSDGKELYFAKSEQAWASGKMTSTIYHSKNSDGQWSEPRIVSFSGTYDDGDPHLTRDGTTLYFVSKRPGLDSIPSADIWKVKRDPYGTWGEPEVLPYPINSKQSEYGPRTDARGNLYFASDRDGGFGQGDLYVSRYKNGKLGLPENMGSILNSPMGEWNLEVNAEGDLIIFEASQRQANVSPYGDLYISFKKDKSWTKPQNLKELNTSGSDLYPYLSPDSNTLFYTSSDSLKGKNTDIYVTEFLTLHRKYRQQAKNPVSP